MNKEEQTKYNELMHTKTKLSRDITDFAESFESFNYNDYSKLNDLKFFYRPKKIIFDERLLSLNLVDVMYYWLSAFANSGEEWLSMSIDELMIKINLVDIKDEAKFYLENNATIENLKNKYVYGYGQDGEWLNDNGRDFLASYKVEKCKKE